LKVWALDGETRQWSPAAQIVGEHRGQINSVAFHPTRSDLFLTASDDGTVKLWQAHDSSWVAINTLLPANEADAEVWDATFIPGEGDVLKIACGGPQGAYLWESPESA